MKRFAVLFVVALAACASVDETEHCVATRYGAVIDEKVTPGLSSVMFSDLTCLPLTQQVTDPEMVTLFTKDSVQVGVDLSYEWRYSDAGAAWKDKRSHEMVVAALTKASSTAARNSMSTIAMADLFSSARSSIDEKFHKALTEEVPPYVVIGKVYVQKVEPPRGIVQAWTAAAASRAKQQEARDGFIADSLRIRRELMEADASARKTRLENEAILAVPMQVRVAAEYARGLANVCAKATTCILGGSVMDTWDRGARVP